MKSVRILNGYRVVYRPEHPKAMKSDNWHGYIYEHIVKAEESIGRHLKKEEDVHHLNGNRSDNRSENLLVLEHSQHAKLHVFLNGKMVESESRFCAVCGLVLNREQKKCCSVDCLKRYRNSRKKPTLKEIEDMLNGGMSMCAVGRKYGVSDNAVRKWIKKYKEDQG